MPTYPGVYIQELPSAVRTITGVSTSITAFIGRALKGPEKEPRLIHNFADYERIFGGLWRYSNMSYAIYQYFQNGGKDALIVRVVQTDASKSTVNVDGTVIEALSPGEWSKNLAITIPPYQNEEDIPEIVDAEKNIPPVTDPPTITLFDLVVKERVRTSNGEVEITPLETYHNLSTKRDSPRFVTKVLERESSLVRVDGENVVLPPARPAPATYTVENNGIAGSDGGSLDDPRIEDGLTSFNKADLFNLLCIPPYDPVTNTTSSPIYEKALSYLDDENKRAIVLIDPPSEWKTAEHPAGNIGINSPNFRRLRKKNAAIYFPRIIAEDPLDDNRRREFVPCGVIAGIIARTDSERGVWKSPAGIESSLSGVFDLTVFLTDEQNGVLNPLGINCLRILPPAGIVVWGARTMRGADQLADQWKYLSVRRMALYIEESLYRGTQWVVFEPNDEPLWAQIRLNIGAFMQGLFRQGAFQGTSPKEAYLVKCDKETTTQDDINRGIVNIIVGFAPLMPAEFVILKIQQLAGRERE